MKKIRNITLLIALLLILACSLFPYELTVTKKDTEQAGEQPSATDTAIVFDTTVPIKTIAETAMPSSTLAPSSTPLPTKTLIPTKTATLTLTKTLIPSRTAYYCPQAAIGTPCP